MQRRQPHRYIYASIEYPPHPTPAQKNDILSADEINRVLRGERVKGCSLMIRDDVNFDNPREVQEAVTLWTQRGIQISLVLEVEPLNNAGRYNVLGYKADDWKRIMRAHGDYVAMNVQLPNPIAIQSQMPQFNAAAGNEQGINYAQSVHAATVHESVTKSLRKLDERYGKRVNMAKNIQALKDFAKNINQKNFPGIEDIKLQAAIDCIARLNDKFLDENHEQGTQFTIRKQLALVWEAMHDKTMVKDIHAAEEKFIKTLYEIQRGYNLDARERDDGQPARPICVGGHMNQFVNSLNAVHPDVEILVITKEVAGYKVMGIARDCLLDYLKNNKDAAKILEGITKTKYTVPNEDPKLVKVLYSLPDEVWAAIKDKVAEQMHSQFDGFLNKSVVDGLSAEGENWMMDEDQYHRLMKEASPKAAIQEPAKEVKEVKEPAPVESSGGKPEIEGYHLEQSDYKKTINGVGVCEIQGRRDGQEDRLVVATQQQMAGMSKLNDEQIETSFKSAFADLEEKTKDLGNASVECGSTGLCAAAWVDPNTKKLTACTANLGDSEAIMVVIRKGGRVEAKRLNELHNPDNADEQKRVGKGNIFSIDGKKRLGGVLAVTRAFGDHALDEVNLGHEPDVKIDRSITLAEGDRAFMVVGCDGMTEGIDKKKKSADVIAEIISNNRDKSPEAMAEALVNNAFSRSRDNISASVFAIGTTPTSVVICDGHGGDAVSEQVSKGLYKTLENKFNVALGQKAQAAAAPSVQAAAPSSSSQAAQGGTQPHRYIYASISYPLHPTPEQSKDILSADEIERVLRGERIKGCSLYIREDVNFDNAADVRKETSLWAHRGAEITMVLEVQPLDAARFTVIGFQATDTKRLLTKNYETMNVQLRNPITVPTQHPQFALTPQTEATQAPSIPETKVRAMEKLLELTTGGTFASKSRSDQEFLKKLVDKIGAEHLAGLDANAKTILRVLDIRKDEDFLKLLDSNFKVSQRFMQSLSKLTKQVILPNNQKVNFEVSQTLGKYFRDAPQAAAAASSSASSEMPQKQQESQISKRKPKLVDVSREMEIMNNILAMINAYISQNPGVIQNNSEKRRSLVLDIATQIYLCAGCRDVSYNDIGKGGLLPQLNDPEMNVPSAVSIENGFAKAMQDINKIVNACDSKSIKSTIGKVIKTELDKLQLAKADNQDQAEAKLSDSNLWAKPDRTPDRDKNKQIDDKPAKRLKT